MLSVIGSRLLQLPLAIFAISFVTFGLSFVSGNPSLQFVGESWTQEEIAEFQRERGFDRPWVVQYVDHVSKAVQGDFGLSWRHNEEALRLVVERLPVTFALAGLSLLVTITIALPVGILSALHRNSAIDRASMFVALTLQSAPTFWIGIMLIMFLAVQARWLPVSGATTWQHFVMPALALGTHYAGRSARLVRSSMLEVLHSDYVRTARSKGLGRRLVVLKHALRNSLIPVVAMIGLDMGNMIAGSVVIESVFAMPGIGRLALQALVFKDLPLLQTIVTLFALSFVAVNLCVDLMYRVLDPRIRLT